MSTPNTRRLVPSLETICTEVVSAHDYWIVQKRHLQYLPEHTANRLLQLLLQRGRLQSPALLDVFRHSVTQLHINAKELGLQLGAEWVAYIAGLGNLQQLSLQYSTRLKDKHLTPLTRLCGCLTSLDITGCGNITNKACAEVLGQLTSLQHLVVTGTGIRPPILTHLSTLTRLTHLNLGGCEVSNNDITSHITTFRNLQNLNLWGSQIKDSSVAYLLQLPDMRQLSLAWSQIRSVMPMHKNLTALDLSHCQLEGSWQAAVGLLIGAVGMRLRELVMARTEVSPAFGEVLETVLRGSSPHLQILDLTGLRGCDLLPLLLSLESATALRSLSLSAAGLTDDYCPALVPLASLQTLDLSLNHEITALGLNASLPGLRGLRRLNLTGTGFRDHGLGVLWALPRLQELVLADTGVTWEWEAAGSDRQGRSVAQQQQQEEEEGVAIDPSSRQQGGEATLGWQCLQVLDLSTTRVTDAGCVQLAKQLAQLSKGSPRVSSSDEANAVEGGVVASTAAISDSGGGLRVLSVGSSSSSSTKISKKGLAALAKITSLRHLTLQGCQLQDRDLKHISQLQQLQQLHIQHIDPWLLSDQALQELPELYEMPELVLVTRDGKILYNAATAAAAVGSQGQMGVGGGSSVTGQGGVDWQQQQSWLQQDPIRLLGEDVAAGMQVPRSPGSSSSSNSRAVNTPGGSATKPTRRKVASPANGAATVFKRLSDYDERYRYSKEYLLQLQQQQQQAEWEGLSSVPEWLRASSHEKWR